MPEIEIRDEGRGIFGIFINNVQIGTIHCGSEHNQEDTNIVHINLQPIFYQSRYRITEVSIKGDSAYLCLEREEVR